jgi:hypothetical protein
MYTSGSDANAGKVDGKFEVLTVPSSDADRSMAL